MTVSSQILDYQRYMFWYFSCSKIRGKRWLFVLLIFVELITITISTFFLYSAYSVEVTLQYTAWLSLRNVIEIQHAMMEVIELAIWVQFDCLFDGVSRHFQQYFSYIMTVSFIGGGNQRTQRKPPTCRKSLKNLSHNVVLIEYTSPWSRFERATSVVIGNLHR